MKKIIPILIVSAMLFIGCNNSANNAAAEKEKYQQAKESLQEKEAKNPGEFLLVSSTNKHNIIGQTVIKGTVNNNAKVCIYKDVQLELTFFSKTGALLLTTTETVYNTVEPGKTVSFKAKEFAPRGTDSVAIKVIGAKTNL